MVNRKVLHVLAGRPLAPGAGWEPASRSAGVRHNIELHIQLLQTPGVGWLPKQIPVPVSSLGWSYWCPKSLGACSGSFDRCHKGIWALGTLRQIGRVSGGKRHDPILSLSSSFCRVHRGGALVPELSQQPFLVYFLAVGSLAELRR